MKRKYFFPILTLIALISAVVLGLKVSPRQVQNPVQTKQELNIITIEAGFDGSTPFGLLQEYAQEKSLVIKTKVYSFGTLVEAIDEKQNTSELSWIYFVNGISGDMAADKKMLKSGDVVEWKYIKPEF